MEVTTAHDTGLNPKAILGNAIKDSIMKKAELFDSNIIKYAIRSMYASMFLVLGTSIAMITSDYANAVAPGAGKFIYAFMFAWSLVMIVYMNGELGTSNMMYMTVAIYKKYLPVKKAVLILATCILFNLIGGIIFAYLMAQTNIFSHLEPDAYLFSAVSAKLDKTILQMFVEGIFANIVVNTSVYATTRMVDGDGRIFATIFIIFIFAFLGFEHVIANFCSFPLAIFVNGGFLEGMTIGKILINFAVAMLGNYIGGGLIIGLSYAWLADGQQKYVD